MKKTVVFIILIALAFFVVFTRFASAQETQKPKCPLVRIEAPDTDQPVWTIKAVVEGIDTSELHYKWTVLLGNKGEKGEILSGQGTDTITIAAHSIQKGVWVSVEIIGIPDGCFNRPTWGIIS